MTLKLGCIADDYTGASDLANTLTRCGLLTVQTIGIPASDLKLPDADAVVIALKSRSIDASEAVQKSRDADQWLRARGAPHVMFKVCSTFDSTDAGNIGPVADALRTDAGEAIALVTPAFPETGRTVYQGNLFVGAVPLNESPLKDHPLNPMHDANLVRVLGRQSKFEVGLADRAVVAKGADVLRLRLRELAAQHVGTVIADAVENDDLDVIGTVALDSRVSVGASGLGYGIARSLARKGTVPRNAQLSDQAPVGGLAACLAGSCSQATLQQIAAAEGNMPVLRLDPERLLRGPEEAAAAIAWARERLGEGPILIASSAAPDKVRAVQERHGRGSGHAIEQAMADIAAELIAAGVRRLVVAGGETSGAVVDRLGLPAFVVGDEIAPGVPILRTVGEAKEHKLLALKSGNFGGPNFFAEALTRMC